LADRDLVAQIIEYHDATKHRHSAVVGQGLDYHVLKPAPKQAMGRIVFNERGLVPHNEEHTLQSITVAYRAFMVQWLCIARLELEAVFGQSLATPLS